MYNTSFIYSVEWGLLRATIGENDIWRIPYSVYDPFTVKEGVTKICEELRDEPNVLFKFYVLKRILRDVHDSVLEPDKDFEQFEKQFKRIKYKIQKSSSDVVELIIPEL